MASNALLGGAAESVSSPGRWRARQFVIPVLALAAFILVAAGLQKLAGAYDVELSGYPDEPGHFVTGVMIQSYLTTLPPRPLVPFAKEFYIHRPRVAIGHWPPVLYLLEGVWFLLFHVSRHSALALMALICASVAASIFHVVRKWHGTLAGIAAGLLFVCLSFVQTQTSEVMADMLVTFFGFWATLSFADFLKSRRARDICRFALFALLAIFTKNNGLYLVFTPVISMLLTKQLRVLRSPLLWFGATVVAIPTALWIVWSSKYVVSSWVEKPGLAFVSKATLLNLYFFYVILGPCFLILIIAGMIHGLIRSRATGDLLLPTLASAALSVFVFQSLVPAGIESRFLLPAIAALVPLLFCGLMWFAESVGPRAVPPMVRAALLLAIGVLISPGRTFAIPQKAYRGFSDVADFIQSQPHLRRGAILVSSDRDGEGLLISEIAMRYPSSEGYILRASKVLSQSDWLGLSYKSRFESADDVFKYLDLMGVDLLVIETRPGVAAPEHQEFLLQVENGHLDHWQPVVIPAKRSPDLKGSKILVYRRIGSSARSDEEIHRDMQEILKRMLVE